jgi:hypothetical protein
MVWEAGAWELSELQDVLAGVEDLDHRLRQSGSSFSASVGRVNIRRFSGVDLRRWYCENVDPKVTPQALEVLRTITLYDEWSSGSNRAQVVVHELAHVWDVGSFEAESIDAYVGPEQRPTDYSSTNADEHWAETAMVWVYAPAQLGFRHQQYMDLAVQGRVPIPMLNLNVGGRR